MSYRITIKEEAAPVAISGVSSTTGAMVIRAPRGPIQPFKATKGQTDLILRKCGYPSATYPDIQEALDYVQDSDLWVSAPYDDSSALYGGVLVGEDGSEALPIGVANPELLNLEALDWKDEIGEGDDATDNFVYVLDKTYVHESLSKIIVDGVEIPVTVTDAEPEEITGSGITAGSTLTRSTGTIDITFDSVPADGAKIEAVYEADVSSETYFTLFSASPHSNDEQVLVSYNTDLNRFEWTFYIKNNRGTFREINSYSGSNIPDTFNASNVNIFMEVLHDNNPYFIVKANTTKTYSTFTDDAAPVELDGGERSSTVTASELQEGWDFFKEKYTYPAKIFMDVTGDPAIPDLFDTLRKEYQKYSRYILIIPKGTDAATAITTKSGYSIDNRGLSFYWNWLYISENYNNTKFWSSRIGKTAIKHAEIIRGAFGGLAPSWFNENGLGGQLSGSVIKAEYDPSEDELRQLDEAGINARIIHPVYGTLITSHKTAQNPNTLTDFSYIAHSGTADYIIERIEAQALVPQLTKLNDDRHRTKVKAIADTLVDPVFGADLLTAYINKCDAENNNADVLNRREFVLTTALQFTPTSEFIIYNFRSAPQGVSLEEVAS